MVEATRSNEPGCLFVFAVVAAELVFVGWFLGQFLLDPALCAGPGCAAMRAALNFSVISAIAGIGCVVLLAGSNAFTIRIPPTLLLVAASGAFAIAAVASVRAGLIILPLFDVVLMLVPTGLLLANDLTRPGTEPPHTRRLSLTWALVGLTIVIAFAVVVSLIVLK
jgi:hypothetical protein